VTIGQNFTQTATDCEQDQTRTRQNREQETTTLVYRNSGSLVTENQTLSNQTSTRNAVGTKETWVATTPVYTSWVNSGGIYGCSNWSPATSTVTSGQTFTQTATDCEQDQTRTRQNREQETTTLVYRNVGGLITENQTLTNQNSSRSATGTKVVTPNCQYLFNTYHWVQNGANPSSIKWNGEFNITSYNASLNYYNYNGYRYYKGSQRGTIAFEICRIPL
jgi:hypothetical protein